MYNDIQPLSHKRLQLVRYKIYIAGKVTGLPYRETFNKFLAAEELLKSLGQEVINPMRIVPPNDTWQNAMRLCMASLCKCNAIYLLDDFKESRGAMIEYEIANQLGFKLINQERLQDVIFRINHVKSKFSSID